MKPFTEQKARFTEQRPTLLVTELPGIDPCSFQPTSDNYKRLGEALGKLQPKHAVEYVALLSLRMAYHKNVRPLEFYHRALEEYNQQTKSPCQIRED